MPSLLVEAEEDAALRHRGSHGAAAAAEATHLHVQSSERQSQPASHRLARRQEPLEIAN